MHLLVDSTGLKLCGAGEWLIEKHGTKTRRSWRKLHIGVDADTGEIVAAELTTNDVDDGSPDRPVARSGRGTVASFTGDGAYDQDDVYRAVTERDPDAAVIVPPRSTAVPSVTAETDPTQRDRHLQLHHRERPDGVAEGVRLQHAQPGRGRHRALQAGDRRRAALSQRRPSDDRGGRRCPGPEPMLELRTPDLRPHRMKIHIGGDPAGPHLTHATTPPPSQRDRHLETIAAQGRLGWQAATGYGRRARVETTMGRYKALIGSRLRARSFAGQQAEAAIGVAVLNRMLLAGRPDSVRRSRKST